MTAESRTEPTSEALVERLFMATIGTMEIAATYLGDRLGFYQALAGGEALTAGELAGKAGTNARYTREWLEHQAVSGIVDVDDETAAPNDRRFSLPAAYATVLADRDSLSFSTPLAWMMVGMIKPIDALEEAFRTGGGVPYEEYGEATMRGIAEGNRIFFINQLATDWLPALPDVLERLENNPSARIADIACGTGWSSIALARALPHVRVDGLDVDAASIAMAQANAAREGLDGQLTFALRNASDPELHGQYDFVTAFECIHDMADPVGALRAMRNLVGDGGTALVADERVAESFHAPADEMERIMYGYSILHCLAVGMADHPSAETGTVMRPATLEQYALEAGFSKVTVLPVEHDVWWFYRLDA